MDRWDRPPPHRNRDNPSFSSSLLDAIYRSIDEPEDATSSRNHTRRAPDRLSIPTTAPSRKPVSGDRITAPVTDLPLPHRTYDHRHRHRPTFLSTSSSSDGSSYGGFSSSDAESAAHSVRPIRVPSRSDPPPPAQEKKKPGSIRSRFRDLRKSRAPASPGARLASFLNSLFTAAATHKKPKHRAPAPVPEETTPCSSASSYTRSCLSKTPSSASRRAPRSVRFCPVGVVVGEDCRPVGEKCIYPAAGAFPEEMEEDDDVASDASSDLFELENLTAIGSGYHDELPVYETTNLGTNRAIAYGFL
ncbi:protein BIG GRAIN 1 [Dioscorea cayenensis subsp. rotundata]|uniref:Protein BIG GRAIN 1 n=1 Tax=Dioscorea cayennensis subsp. rotundata TaxID=55577 RepID=A0AB40D1Q0_DIOCR|nr:protein BIG GRAIN 1 [Dioscorea cayenensis subsp. rotundata]